MEDDLCLTDYSVINLIIIVETYFDNGCLFFIDKKNFEIESFDMVR